MLDRACVCYRPCITHCCTYTRHSKNFTWLASAQCHLAFTAAFTFTSPVIFCDTRTTSPLLSLQYHSNVTLWSYTLASFSVFTSPHLLPKHRIPIYESNMAWRHRDSVLAPTFNHLKNIEAALSFNFPGARCFLLDEEFRGPAGYCNQVGVRQFKELMLRREVKPILDLLLQQYDVSFITI